MYFIYMQSLELFKMMNIKFKIWWKHRFVITFSIYHINKRYAIVQNISDYFRLFCPKQFDCWVFRVFTILQAIIICCSLEIIKRIDQNKTKFKSNCFVIITKYLFKRINIFENTPGNNYRWVNILKESLTNRMHYF